MYILCDTRLYKKGLKIFNESDYEIDVERLIFQVNKKNFIWHRCNKTSQKRGKNNDGRYIRKAKFIDANWKSRSRYQN